MSARRNAELDEELRFHLDQQIEQNLARGMTPEAARTAALVAMGGVERRKDEMRDTRRVQVVENLMRDLRHALRSLRRTPGYTAVALVTLALGLGANTAIFTVVNSVLFQPLAYRDPGRLVAFDGTVSPANYLDWRAQARSFEALGAAEWWSPTLSGLEAPEQITALRITPDVLSLLGVPPLLGRIPTAEEGHAGRDHLLVLGYRSWQQRFAGDSAVLGRRMLLNGESYQVIGVMPESFQFAPYWATNAELWAPLPLDHRATDRNGESLRLFGRLAPGVRLAAAQAELSGIMARLEREYPGTNPDRPIVPLREMVVGDVRPGLLVLLGAVGLVLLIACANVAHLQLLRAAAREREYAVRIALGASRSRMLQQSLVESMVLALGGAILGLGVAWGGVRLLISLSPPSLPRVAAIQMDGWVFAFLLAAALLSSLVFGIGPALRAPGTRAEAALKEGRRSSETPGRRRVRGLLVASEFATALVLLVGAGLLGRSFAALAAVDPGFDTRGALTMNVSLRGTAHGAPALRTGFFRGLVERARTLPGVVAVGATNHLPISGDNWGFTYSIEGQPIVPPPDRPRALFRIAQPGYFDAMRIPIVRGRDFSRGEEAANARVAIVNEAFAQRHWPGADPVGQRITADNPAGNPTWFTIVGVSRSITQTHLRRTPGAEMYYLFADGTPADTANIISALRPAELMLVLRTTGDPAVLARPVRELVRSMDADASVSGVQTLESVMATQFVEPTFYLLLLGSFAGVAIVLAAVGVFGVISWSAERRTHEIGIRLALGASPREPFRLLAREGLGMAALGGAAGLLLAFALTRYLRTLLFGIGPVDPVMFAAAPVILAAVALAACWIPARRASRIDPMTALRSE